MKIIYILMLIPFLNFGQDVLEESRNHINNKSYKKAEIKLSTYLSSNKDNQKAIELLGDAYGYQKKWEDAAKQYKKLIDTEPNSANYQYKYGGALGMKAIEMNKFSALMIIDDIKAAFLKAAELDSNHINTRWALVELYIQLPGLVGGSKNKSLKYANQLEVLSKVDGYLAKGYIYEYNEEPDLAEKFYKMAIKEGGSYTCYSKLTSLYEKKKQPKKAIANMEVTGKIHHRNALHYQIGKVCAEYNLQLKKGEHCLLTYIENHSSKDGVPKAWAFYRLAQIYKHQNHKEKALKYINLAVSKLPNIEVFSDEKSQILSL